MRTVVTHPETRQRLSHLVSWETGLVRTQLWVKAKMSQRGIKHADSELRQSQCVARQQLSSRAEQSQCVMASWWWPAEHDCRGNARCGSTNVDLSVFRISFINLIFFPPLWTRTVEFWICPPTPPPPQRQWCNCYPEILLCGCAFHLAHLVPAVLMPYVLRCQCCEDSCVAKRGGARPLGLPF